MERYRPQHAAARPFWLRTGVLLGVIVVLNVLAVGASLVLLSDDGDDDGAVQVTSGTDTAPASAPTAPEPMAPEATTTTTTRHPVLGNGETVTIAFAGDTNFEGAAARRLAADPASVLGPFAPVLSAADLAVVNMETAIGTGGRPPAGKQFVFQAPREALDAFRAAGVDVVSAANNHGMDLGVVGLQETLAAEEASGFPIIGIGRNEDEAYAPFIAEVRGQRIAVIAATQVLDDDLLAAWTAGPANPGLASAKRVDRLVREVRAARGRADTVVVFLHWGIETHTCPSKNQQELARVLIDAGADVLVGGHAHRLQGGGRLGDAVVHYGLGNFGFQTRSVDGARTGVFVVSVTGRRVDGYEWMPGRIIDHQPVPLQGAAAEAARRHWDGLRGCTGLAP